MMTQLPGFSDPVHDAQNTFRALLNALSHPGKPHVISATLTPPVGLIPACGAACLTLFDLETWVWLSPAFQTDVKAWLQFHTGCRFTPHPQSAHFAILPDMDAKFSLDHFNMGTAEQPEQSTTLLIQLQTLMGGQSVLLKGPGIQDQQGINLPLPDEFWQEWHKNTQNYPLGIDIFFISQNQVIGLPRTAQLID
jgi:alpha-D-ribose 1-methylphosphonate 5-triphosphate synthase subunit PhnH